MLSVRRIGENMTKIKNSCVLITGGASGIGRIMGRMALEKGARQVVIWDINERTSRKILRAIERNTDFRGIPWSYHFFRLCQGLLPVSWFDTIVGRWLGIYSTMDYFKGRK